MRRVRLQSRMLASARYDPDHCQLELEFRSGQRYRFFRVPPDCYEQFLRAESKGAYFNRSIRNRFAFQDLSADSAPIVMALAKN